MFYSTHSTRHVRRSPLPRCSFSTVVITVLKGCHWLICYSPILYRSNSLQPAAHSTITSITDSYSQVSLDIKSSDRSSLHILGHDLVHNCIRWKHLPFNISSCCKAQLPVCLPLTKLCKRNQSFYSNNYTRLYQKLITSFSNYTILYVIWFARI